MDIDEFLDNELKNEDKAIIEIKQEEKKVATEQETIDKKFMEIKGYIESKSFSKAENVFEEINKEYEDFEKRQKLEKEFVFNELMGINNELIENLSSIKQDLGKKITIIKNLIQKAYNYIQMNNIRMANELYSQIREMYRQLPDAFNENKLLLENEILLLYIKLMDALTKQNHIIMTKEINKINSLINSARFSVDIGKKKDAIGKYNKVISLYKELPKGFLYEKAITYKKILELYKQIVESDKDYAPNTPNNADEQKNSQEAAGIEADSKQDNSAFAADNIRAIENISPEKPAISNANKVEISQPQPKKKKKGIFSIFYKNQQAGSSK